MCGIVGYIGKKNVADVLLFGLKRLEYRGYDSAGIALGHDGRILRYRKAGRVDDLITSLQGQSLAGSFGIGHTRWATHGPPTDANAHPHLACSGKLALAHNGIIENYAELKQALLEKRGFGEDPMFEKEDIIFSSETDSEVLAHLIGSFYQGDLLQAVSRALPWCRGTYGIAVIHANEPDTIVVARKGSPIAIGLGEGENFIGSDTSPMLAYTRKVIFLEEGEMAKVTAAGVTLLSQGGQSIARPAYEVPWNEEQAQKRGFPTFMLKEIHEQPASLQDAIRGRMRMEQGDAQLGGLQMTDDDLRKIKRVLFVACGTAYYAGMVGKYLFSDMAGMMSECEVASEFRYRNPTLDAETLVFVISQSGETLDTLEAMREAKRRGAVVRGIVNVVGSTIARECGAGIYIHAGPEQAVASTKAFTNMVGVIALLALKFARLKHMSLSAGQEYASALAAIPKQIEEILRDTTLIERFAAKYKGYEHFLYLGRGINYPVALEGSLKLKEISYIHSEASPAGEMKHGMNALLDARFPVFGILTKHALYEKMKSNIMEVQARTSPVILLASEGDEEAAKLSSDVLYVPLTMPLLQPLLNTIPLQLFAYYVARERGLDVDKPRNLAKSVTVE